MYAVWLVIVTIILQLYLFLSYSLITHQFYISLLLQYFDSHKSGLSNYQLQD